MAAAGTIHLLFTERMMHSNMMRWLYMLLSLSVVQGFTRKSPLARTIPSFTRLLSSPTPSVLVDGPLVGRGSYGRVHLCTIGEETVIGKRAYVLEELANVTALNDPHHRLKRCEYYFHVERHCFEKMAPHPQIPNYRGVMKDKKGNAWMTFDTIKSHSNNCAPNLQQVMEADWQAQHESDAHHLSKLEEALELTNASFGETLDLVFESLLEVLTFVHSQHIVHRDVKPGNLIIAQHKLHLIDFGSAAAMDPQRQGLWGETRVGLENDKLVACSPVYSAPELFIRPDRAPYQFDVFSAALIICQLLFNYLDERTDAGFHQQLEDAEWDLDLWLSRELGSKVRPAGLEEALEYLSARSGLWRLLGDMLRRDPELRVSSQDALRRWQFLQSNEATDGPFFESVVALMDQCEVAPPTVQRPLHFVATFRRSVPLGLVLSEANSEDAPSSSEWIEAMADAEPGEVFVQGILPESQADQMGIFEVGDRLQGVGDLPLGNRGFERVVEMLERQPKSAKYVKLHFDRRAARKPPLTRSTFGLNRARVVSQGAWSSTGRRKAQEDTVVLHEIHEEHDILLAGVFDGHGGTAASHTAARMVPYLMSETLRQKQGHAEVRLALEQAWETTCDTYRHGCLEEECVADYDPMQGTLQANTGSTELVAGTTASLVAVHEGTMTVLNCGDSRSLLFGMHGDLLFSTVDHSPDTEMERLARNSAYSTPECSLSRWYLSVGDYQYALARSLEGPFATSKGIVSDPDIVTVPLFTKGILVMASDGLFEVMDNEEVGRNVLRFRLLGESAGDAAKKLCSLAIEKGTSDNVSVVVVYLE